ncbi:hypothetical protein J6X73_01095 [Candidatus Saccharibacteria bacterium]|nr:hypothetical protein [Candidatus Saccharibacteria bacterium]
MYNPNNFSESGYGHNEDGTEMNRDDYYAENSQGPTDKYYQAYDEAGKEEEAEYRKIEADQDREMEQSGLVPKELLSPEERLRRQNEALAKYREGLQDMLAKADEMMAELKKLAAEAPEAKAANSVPTISQQDLGSKAAGAATISQSDLGNRTGVQPIEHAYDQRTYQSYSSPEEWRKLNAQ